MRYLFSEWDNLCRKLKDKRVFLFLDYDGTLTPIVSAPQKAIIPKQVKELLGRLLKNPKCSLAIISGRALKDIINITGLKGIIYSGNHGLQIEGPKIKFEAQIPPAYKAALKQIKDNLKKRLSRLKGAFVEDKGLSLTLHYRLADKKRIPQAKTIFHEATILYLVRNKIRIKTGKMALEIRPPVEWDKGKVVLWLLARQKFALKEKDLVPVYIGDDKTDEDAFKVLKNKGITIFVGKPNPSYARYYLKDTGDVKKFLRMLLALQRGATICEDR